MKLNKKLNETVHMLLERPVPEERQVILRQMVEQTSKSLTENGRADLVFICTHNSRRSHMAQLWAHAAAAHLGLDNVHTWSGGTEATAFFKLAVQALQNDGFEIIPPKESSNPVYRVLAGPDQPIQEAFSKVYNDPFNPQEGYIAVMTCNQADEACPIVHGAASRISLTYEDPKHYDGHPSALHYYEERSHQIGSELLWAFSRIHLGGE